MQIQTGCTVKLNCKIMATHTGVHIALVSPFAYWCHADHSGLSFVFIILYKKQKQNKTHKPVLAILVTEKRKRNSKFLSPCWFEKNQVVRLVGTYIWHIHIWHIYIWGENMNQQPLQSGELTSLHLSSSRGKGTAGLGRQKRLALS